MTPTTPGSLARRTVRVLLDTALRAASIVMLAEVLAARASVTDALAGGLMTFAALSAVSFVSALLDGMLQRDRPRLVAVWALVGPVVALAEVAASLYRSISGPGAYPSLEAALAAGHGDAGWFLFVLLLVAVPAAVGVGLGLLICPRTATPSPGPDAARTPVGTPGGTR